jgi:hypothetical protein
MNISNLISPTGSYDIQIDSWEACHSRWVQTPEIVDLYLQDTILKFHDPSWSMNTAEWIDHMAVQVTLRKYPGNHIPAELTITIECKNRLAILPNGQKIPLIALEDQLDLLLQWQKK